MQLQSHLMCVGGQIQMKPAKLNHLRKVTTNFTSSDRDALIGLTEFVHTVRVIYEKR